MAGEPKKNGSIKFMKDSKVFSRLLLCLNIIGVLCLVYFAIPYLTHNTQIPHPDAMLPAERWDLSGMALTAGIIPLVIANLLGFLFVKEIRNRFRLLCSFCQVLYALPLSPIIG